MRPELIFFYSFSLALLYDRLWGELPTPLHPVVWMGKPVTCLQKQILSRGKVMETSAGFILAIVHPLTFMGLALVSIEVCRSSVLATILMQAFWLKASFAWRALGAASQTVQEALAQQNLEAARLALSSLCSRSADELSQEQLIEATVSSLAENHSDSILAPWLFAACFGVGGAVFYRAVNTLDAMVGYRNHLRYFGYASAKLDDLCNLIPARLSALSLWAASLIERRIWQRYAWQKPSESFAICWRDHALTPSPNGGWPMAMMAGILGIRLRKPGVYQLGEARRPLSLHQSVEAWHCVCLSNWLCLPFIYYLGMLLAQLR